MTTELGLDLRGQIASDLEQALSQYMDSKKGMRMMAEGIGVHQRTLRRLLSRANTPGYLTIYKIYRYLLGTTNDTKLLELVPLVVKKELIGGNPKDLDKKITFSMDIDHEIATDKVFCELYFLADSGFVTEEFIQFRFGAYGSELLGKMLELNVLTRTASGELILGENRANLSTETIKRVGLQLLDKYFNPSLCDEPGENFVGFFVEGISKEGYNEWLRVDQDAYYKKVELSKQYKDKNGVRGFTFSVTDTLSNKPIYTDWN